MPAHHDRHPHRIFTDRERDTVYEVIRHRRDIRHFVAGAAIDETTLCRLLAAAHAGPSVGLMQPWRFIRITDHAIRAQLHRAVDGERLRTADALGPRAGEFLELKVEGVLECAELLVVALRGMRDRHIFGRRSMPEMDIASVSCAIENMWLAARAENLGMGWVSIFEPSEVSEIIGIPADAAPIALLCLGPVHEFPSRPLLELQRWATARPLDDVLWENTWQEKEP